METFPLFIATRTNSYVNSYVDRAASSAYLGLNSYPQPRQGVLVAAE
jgi:hypothetical protein